MRMTESKLRRIIRSVIAEGSLDMGDYSDLKTKLSNIVDMLKSDLYSCSGDECYTKLNRAISAMSDAWVLAGGNSVGYFVDACEIGQEMHELQKELLNMNMSPDDLQEALNNIDINSCNFSELTR